ncbi:MAG: VWA domain-containing protein [Chloroflexi bacterium]|nr:VWA domain-containing protein [Chloroflexota bacterium]
MHSLQKRLFTVLYAAWAIFFSSFAYGREALDVVFVLDCSGSMQRETSGSGSPSRMELAARAIELFVIGMGSGDTVGVSGFSWETTFSIPPEPVSDAFFAKVNEKVFSHVEAVKQGGYTDILLGLRNGAAMLERIPAAHGRRKVMILLTDGRMQSRSPADISSRYGPGTESLSGAQWRPLIARDAAWFIQNEIPVYTILLGTEREAAAGDVDLQFVSLVASLTHGAFSWAKSGEDLRPIYQRLWHQLANRPIPEHTVKSESVEVHLGERISEMQVVLSESRSPGWFSRRRSRPMEATFFHNNLQWSADGMPGVSLSSRRGVHAIAYLLTNPPAGVWRIEPSGMEADIWVDVKTWWGLEPKVLGSDDDELDIAQPFRFEVAVVDNETRIPIEDTDALEKISAFGIVSSVESGDRLHANGQVQLSWDPVSKAFVGELFTQDGRTANVAGTFNALCKVQFSETHETAPHALVVRRIPPVGRLVFFPERIAAFGAQGETGPLASVSPEGTLVNPAIHLEAGRDVSADIDIVASDLKHLDSAYRIDAERVVGAQRQRLSARETVELSLKLTVPADAPAGTYQGTLSARSGTHIVTGAETPITVEIGGPPVNVVLEAVLEPGGTKRLTAPLHIPVALLPHATITGHPLRGPDGAEVPLASAKIEGGEVRIDIRVPEDARGGVYEADLPVRAPGLAAGRARVRVDVVRHIITPEQLHFVLLPGKSADASIVVQNTASQPLQYHMTVRGDSLPPGVKVSVTPASASATHDMPAQFRVTSESAASLSGTVKCVLAVRSDLGPVAEIPVNLTVIGLSVERISRHDAFRVAAGGQSGAIEYRITTSSPEPLKLDVIAEELVSDTGRPLPPDAVVFESGKATARGRIEITVADAEPATLSVRVSTENDFRYARGAYEGAFVVTSPGFSEYREPLKLQVGAIWLEGINPLTLGSEEDRWDGQIRILCSLSDPTRVTSRVRGDPTVVAAVTLDTGDSMIPSGKPLEARIRVEQGRIPYGRHALAIEFDTEGIAGTATWNVLLDKQPPGLAARPSPLHFPDLLGGTVSQESQITTTAGEVIPISATLTSLSQGVSRDAITVSLSGNQVRREAPVTLTVAVNSRSLLPGDYRAIVVVQPDDKQVRPLEIPVTMQAGGLRDVILRFPSEDARHGGARVIQRRQQEQFRVQGSVAGRMDLRTIMETYRVQASLLASDGASMTLEVSPVPVTSATRDVEWIVAVPPLQPGKYTLAVTARNIHLDTARETAFEFYVRPPFAAAMTSGGLAGFPARFEARVNPEDLGCLSDFRTWIILTGPNQRERRIDLVDDGTRGDTLTGDGVYTGTYLLPNDQLGRWTWKDFHAFRIGDRKFEIDPEQEFVVDAGIWIRGTRISRRDPGVLAISRRVTRLGRGVDVRVSTSSTGWTPVSVELGGIRTVGTKTFEGAMPEIKMTSGESRARATEPFEARMDIRAGRGTPAGDYLVPVSVSVGAASAQTATLEFRIWRLAWWGKILAFLLAAVCVAGAIRLIFSMGSLVLDSASERNPIRLANRLQHPLPVSRVNIREDCPRRHMSESVLCFVRIPFTKTVWCSSEVGQACLNGALVSGRVRMRLNDTLEFPGRNETLEFKLEGDADVGDNAPLSAASGVVLAAAAVGVLAWILVAL